MIHAALQVGAVVLMARTRRAVVLEVVGDRAVIAPVVDQPRDKQRGDVTVWCGDLGILVSTVDAVVRCASARVVARRGMTTIGGVSPERREQLANAVRRAAASRAAEAGPSIRLVALDNIGSRGRRIGGGCAS